MGTVLQFIALINTVALHYKTLYDCAVLYTVQCEIFSPCTIIKKPCSDFSYGEEYLILCGKVMNE